MLHESEAVGWIVMAIAGAHYVAIVVKRTDAYEKNKNLWDVKATDYKLVQNQNDLE